MMMAKEKKYRGGKFGDEWQIDRLARDNKSMRKAMDTHEKILSNREIGDIGFPMKRFIMEDENGSPVSIRPQSDGTWKILPFNEDTDT